MAGSKGIKLHLIQVLTKEGLKRLQNIDSGQPTLSKRRAKFQLYIAHLHTNIHVSDIGCSGISVYLSSLPVAHLSDAPRRRLVVTGGSARIQNETTESSTWFFNMLGV